MKKITNTVAQTVSRMCSDLHIPFYFKASYKKANRSSLKSFTGIGTESIGHIGFDKKERKSANCNGYSYGGGSGNSSLCCRCIANSRFFVPSNRSACGGCKNGRIVNIKKRTILVSRSHAFAVQKVRETGNDQVMITERGTTFAIMTCG
jgi:2-dehydro-3-deoxyphosphooctonate aldolase (KDO 8-P synthase)